MADDFVRSSFLISYVVRYSDLFCFFENYNYICV